MAKKFNLLTRDNCRELKAGNTINEHGIEYRKGSDGDGTFTVGIMVDGTRIHRVMGRESEGVTRTVVEKFIEQARTEARNQRLSLPKGRKHGKLFDEAATEYLKIQAATNAKNLESKIRTIEKRLIPYFRKRPLASITTEDVDKYRVHRSKEVAQVGVYRGKKNPVATRTEGRTLSQATINREIAVLSHLFTQAKAWGWNSSAPPQFKKVDEGPGRREFMTLKQQAALRVAVAKSGHPDLPDFVEMGLDTSMRAGEIFATKKCDVDINRLIIHIENAKAGARDQPITPALARILENRIASLPENEVWLFPARRKASTSGHRESITKPFARAVREAGLDPKKVLRHTMRHTAITDLIQANVNLPTVQQISGHKTMAMVLRYFHASGVHTQAAMEKLQAHRKAR